MPTVSSPDVSSHFSAEACNRFRMPFDPVVVHTLNLINYRRELKRNPSGNQALVVPEEYGRKPALLKPALEINFFSEKDPLFKE
ncbi:unnamed protein product [Enterobius vermicularis]|uniref:Carn_acyltransf domain-containing protein n=1 Tax=Enterobius vermicularis TaxID=51028 RepID=A0A0N4VJL8_ENTVE|nr:unnamed protein product [Enterobius vermicularis]